MHHRVEMEWGGRTLSIETGHVARQANGAVMVRYGDTVVLTAVVASKSPKVGFDYFPLMVDYREKTSAAGKIPGGFFKREGRPTEKETLSARLIDRPIRPLFPDGYMNDVQVHVVVLSSDRENDADVLGVIGTGAALALSDLPFKQLVAGVRIGQRDGQLVANPLIPEYNEIGLNIIVAGTSDNVTMVEGEACEVSEDSLVAALEFGHAEIRKVTDLIAGLREKAGKAKIEFAAEPIDEELARAVTETVGNRIKDANQISEKEGRQETIDAVFAEVAEALDERFPEQGSVIHDVLHDLEKADLRARVLNDARRADGRSPDQVRPITCDVGLLPRTHGSAIFTRGQTQSLVTVTLGTKVDEQRIDDLAGDRTRSYMLHYNFPPYSVGETRPIRGPGRREIGHGKLAERALEPVIPSREFFPYTLRIVSDILESNGSSSMASVCGGTLAMMDAGVPIKAPVAGVAMGLIMEGDRWQVLTDILGVEDHLGDMDFKVTGTADGITAIQMDIKIEGLSFDIMRQALANAREGRLHILGEMTKAIAAPREEMSPYAPRIITLQVPVSKIGDVIGPGGKTIRNIVDTTGAKVDIEDDGTVLVASVDQQAGEAAQEMILKLVEEPELDKDYEGKVRRTADFGAFVEILPGTDGLLPIAEIAHERIEKVEDVVRVGDIVKVKVIEIQPDGRVRLSRRALLPGGPAKYVPSRRPERTGPRGGGGGRGGDRGGRGGRGPRR